ncbi:hypothetical protein COV18_07105 [Candidatus Woesearchaeota archaeon CG10_big_fil_rev_8_21_14_0_10_37_12]|nr:MAG: hypothetical protein COV18_07105 [Candidatus Woesearchaeota archaeon CG10_big_fil_rev_8_21_14_0_10_37_12]
MVLLNRGIFVVVLICQEFFFRDSLIDIKADKIYKWIEEVINRKIQPIFVGSDNPYKDWVVSELLTFRYPFIVGNTEYRILFVKVKNAIYIEFHLGDHKYYDKVRKDLDLKKSSY